MAQYPKITLTNSGLNMIAESQGGIELIFTKMIMGDGELASGEDIKVLTGVKNAMLTVPLQGFLNQGEGQVRLRFTVSNETLNTGFFAREIGVYAKLGKSGTEQLYAYTNAGNKTDYMPDKSVPLDSQILDLYIIVGNATGVSAVLDGNALYATALDLTEHNTSETAHEDIRTAIAEATKKAGLPVGYTYTVDYTELQAGQIPLLGGKYLKSTYTDLWAWVQTHPSMIVTEEQWQTLKMASGGRAVAKYADVDDTHFRVPLVTTWVKGASSLDEVGTVLEAGLPNITGVAGTNLGMKLKNTNTDLPTVNSGALALKLLNINYGYTSSTNTTKDEACNITFDASKSNSIYGKSTTVQPQSVVRLWVVQAFGTNSNVGNMDVAQVAQGITDLTGRVSTLEADSGFTILYPNGGTKESPANVAVNSRYTLDNPFPGYEVECRAEILYSGKWCKACWSNSTVNNGFGIMATHLLPDDNIIVQTGNSALSDSSVINGIGIQNMVTLREAAPCRVKVWKIGKVTA